MSTGIANFDKFLVNPTEGYTRSIYGDLTGLNYALTGDPWFSWADVALMVQHPAVRMGLRLARTPYSQYRLIEADEAKEARKDPVNTGNPRADAYVRECFKLLFHEAMPRLIDAYHCWGRFAAGVEWEYDQDESILRMKNIRYIEPFDTDPQIYTDGKKVGQFAGFKLLRSGTRIYGTELNQLVGPRHAFYFAGHERLGAGCDIPRLAGATTPWKESVFPGGGRASLRLWGFTRASGITVVRYPEGDKVNSPYDGTPIKPQDAARITAERLQNGAILSLSNKQHATMEGKYAWEIEQRDVPGGGSEGEVLIKLNDRQDSQILLGMEIFEEIFKTADGGASFSGKSMPMECWYTQHDEVANMIWRSFRRQQLDRALKINFGIRNYTADLNSLLDEFRAQSRPPGVGGQGGAPRERDASGHFASKGAGVPGGGMPDGTPGIDGGDGDPLAQGQDTAMLSGIPNNGRGKWEHRHHCCIALAMIDAKLRELAGQESPDKVHDLIRWLPHLAHDDEQTELRNRTAFLAWMEYGQSRSGKKRWKDTATGEVRYQESEPGTWSARREQMRGTAAAGHEIAKRIWANEHSTADLQAFEPHLHAMTVQDLRKARRRLGAAFKNATKRDDMVKALTDHVRQRIQDASAPPETDDIRSPEFKRWFEGSAVKSADGAPKDTYEIPEPKLLYHGTAKKLDKFDPEKNDPDALFGAGFYFTEDPEVAATYTKKDNADGAAGEVKQAYLAIKKPLDLDNTKLSARQLGIKLPTYQTHDGRTVVNASDFEGSGRLRNGVYEEMYTPENLTEDTPLDIEHWKAWARNNRYGKHEEIKGRMNPVTKVFDPYYRQTKTTGVFTDFVRRHIIPLGYDGFTHVGGNRLGAAGGEGKEHRVWVAFDPNQIKLTGQEPEPQPKPLRGAAALAVKAAHDRKAGLTAGHAKRADGTPVAPHVTDVHTVNPASLHVDPERFQYKISGIGKGGITDQLKGSKKWNPELGGTLLVWRDPMDGKDYVVNGHHRHELATRTGTDKINARYIDAPNAKVARARGALANIAAGHGTATDAAKYMRDSGDTVEDLRDAGISMSGKIVQDAAALKDLSDKSFQKVTEGKIPETTAAIVARHVKDHALQDKLFSMIERRSEEGKEWGPKDLETAAKMIAAAGTVTKKDEGGLFGDFEDEESIFPQQVELNSYIGSKLNRDHEDYVSVSNAKRAERVKGSGNVLALEENRKMRDKLAGHVEDFDRESKQVGDVADIVKAGAAKLALAKKKQEKDAIKDETLQRVRDYYEQRHAAGAGGGSKPLATDAGGTADNASGAPGTDAARGGGSGGASPDEPGKLNEPAAPAPAAPPPPPAEPEPEPTTAPGTDLFGGTSPKNFGRMKPKEQATLEDLQRTIKMDKAKEWADANGAKVEGYHGTAGTFKANGGKFYHVGTEAMGHPVVGPHADPLSAQIDAASQQYVHENYPELRDKYLEENATPDGQGGYKSVVMNTDEWRHHLPGYNGTNSGAVHEASSTANKKLYAEMLKAQKGKGNQKLLVLAGGGGSGKGTATGQFFDQREFPLVLDQVSDNFKKLTEELDEGKANGFNPDYVFIDRPVEKAWGGPGQGGVVGRALSLRSKGKIARTVSAHLALHSNMEARKVALRILNERPDIPVRIIDNTGEDPADRRLIKDPAEAKAFLEKRIAEEEAAAASGLHGKLKAQTHAAYKAGRIDQDIARGLLGNGDFERLEAAHAAADANPGRLPEH